MDVETLITDPLLQKALLTSTSARAQTLDLLSLLSERGSPYLQQPATSTSLSSSPPNESHNGPSSSDDALFTAQRQLTARLALLRGLNRKALMQVRSTKAETAEARQEVDGLHLGLQNLYYEQRHLVGEIRGCEGFDHKYLSLPMVPVEEFLAAHEELADASEHELTLARIHDEHEARLALEAQKQELVKRKDALVKETTAKKEELAKLDLEVEKWVAAQEPARKIFEAREKKIHEMEAVDTSS